MAEVFKGRYTAHVENDFVVFLIGMKVNRLWKLHKWVPVAREMTPMIKTLFGNPEKGMLGARFGWMGGPLVVQYWRSFDDLDSFARRPGDPHRPAWQRYNKNVGRSGDVGIWHETFKVRAGEYECVYGNMPRVGLAAAGEHVPVGRKSDTAAQRIGAAPAESEEKLNRSGFAEKVGEELAALRNQSPEWEEYLADSEATTVFDDLAQ